MGRPHIHAKIICAWANGQKIQYRQAISTSYDGKGYTEWFDLNSPNPMWDATEYRIKPEPVYPVSKMTDDELVSKYYNGGPVSHAEEYRAWRRIADTSILRAIQDGDVILPSK